MRDDYKAWLKTQNYADNTQVAQVYRVLKVEQSYGDLEEIYSQGKLSEVIAELSYSTADERAGKINPSRIIFDGNIRNNLASYRNAVSRYALFLSGQDATESLANESPISSFTQQSEKSETSEKQRLSLERDMQAALRTKIGLLEPGLTIIDDGAERAVQSGFVDILCRDASGAVVVVELKAGKTDARVIGQVLGYMGDILVEDEEQHVRGIIVAHEFDQRTRSATKAVGNLSLVRYAISFTFELQS